MATTVSFMGVRFGVSDLWMKMVMEFRIELVFFREIWNNSGVGKKGFC